jgi:hypothetical protein
MIFHLAFLEFTSSVILKMPISVLNVYITHVSRDMRPSQR